MAVDVCSEIASLVISPRISFSHDLKENDDIIPIECHHFRSDAFLLESTIDFDFCVTNQSFSQEKISSADELFSNGKILPIEVKKSTPFIEIYQSEPQQQRLNSNQVGIGHMFEPQSLQQQQLCLSPKQVGIDYMSKPQSLHQQEQSEPQQLCLSPKQVGVGYISEPQSLQQQQQYELLQQQLCLSPKQVGIGYMSKPQSLQQQQLEPQQQRSPKQVGIGNIFERKSLQIKAAASVLENGTNVDTKKMRLKEFLSTNLDEEIEKPQAKPFWQFRRSNSLNCENGRSNGLKWSSLQFLSRSNSTGSAPNQKNSKIFLKQNSQKEQIKVLRKSSSLSSSSSSSSSSSFSSFNQSHSLHSSSKRAQSQPLKKSYSRSYGNAIHVSPVLNLPHTYISKGTVCLFGLGSLFCNGKSKKKK